MKLRLLLLFILSLLCSGSLFADNTRVWGWCEKGGQVVVGPGASQSTSKVQASYPGCVVTVFIAGGTTPTSIFNQDGTPLTNPFPASSTTGYWFFYVPNGHYDVQLSSAGFTSPFTLGDITVGGSGGGGSGCGVTSTCTIPQGGTSATTATDATHNLEYIAGTSPTPATGAVAVPDDAAIDLHISVTYFNADTGLTDNSTHFNDAITYLLGRGGGSLFIPCGTWNFTNPVTVNTQLVSIEGESEHCVVLNYIGTGTFLNIVDSPPTGGPHGTYKDFTIALPSGNSSTIGLLSSTSNALYQNIQVTSCSASTAYYISNGVIQAPISPSYEEKNTWLNVNSDHCAKGWEVGSTGTPPTDNFINYNYFDNISGSASMGQVVFQLDAGPWFQHNFINLACKIDNKTTISSTADAVCINSNGGWKYNTTLLNGEWNNSVGSGTGNPYSVAVSVGATFLNTIARLNVLTIPGLGGARIPMNNQAGAAAVSNFQIGADTDADWENGVGAPATAPPNGSLYTDTDPVTGGLYVRQAGAWLKLGGGGGGGGAWNPPPTGSNCVVKYDTGTNTECVPSNTAGYVYQDGSGNVSISSGTGAVPSAINYTPTGTNAGTITQQVKNQESSFLTEWKNGAGTTATCPNSSEDETAALDNAAAASITGIVYIPANTHCYIDNWAARSNTKIYCIGSNSGLSHFAPGTTTSLITGSFISNFEIHGCLLDGKAIGSSQPFLSFGNSTNIVIDANIIQNVGSATTLTTAVQFYKTSGRITNNWATSGDTGQFLVVDDGATAGIRQDILTNHLSGMKTNAILIENSGSLSNLNYGDFLIHGNDISNLTDEQNGTGQFGNGILITNILGGEESNNTINGSLWSGIRHGAYSGMGSDHDNLIYNTLDNGIYCSEEGGFGNHCYGNHLYNTGGLASTNQSLRILNIPDVIEDNWVFGGDAYGFHCEGCVLRHNHAVNTPMGFQLGAGSTTGGSIVEGNECVASQVTGTGGTPNAAVPLGQPMASCFFVDPSTSGSLTERFTSNNLGSGWQLPVGIIGVNNNQKITNITNANPAVVTLSTTPGAAIVVGNLACFFFVESMTQINGHCPAITAVSGLNVTVSLDTTSYSSWVTPTNGSYPSIWGMWNNTTSLPVQGLGSTDLITNMTIPYTIANAGGIKTGSQFVVPDANCVNGALTASGGGTWALKISSRVACMLDAATGTVSGGNGIVNGSSSPASGQIQMLDNTSGHTLTVTPQSGLPSNTTVNLPQ